VLGADHEEVVRHAPFGSVLAPTCQGFDQSDCLGQGRLARAMTTLVGSKLMLGTRERGTEIQARMGDSAFSLMRNDKLTYFWALSLVYLSFCLGWFVCPFLPLGQVYE